MSGTGVVQRAFGVTRIAASGTNLSLGGAQFGSTNQFAESAPATASGTFSLN